MPIDAIHLSIDSGGSQLNREAGVAVGVVDPADDRWLIEFDRNVCSGSE